MKKRKPNIQGLSNLQKENWEQAIDYLDEHVQSCYLETHNFNNVAYYERFGFLTMEVGILPGSDKKHWAMLRKPNNTGQS